ncbi:hypothetical protein GBA52_020435 [Prunus armeniaca]|nr:hypothetical protein GBA52_020435 [Prunus armeniaca]
MEVLSLRRVLTVGMTVAMVIMLRAEMGNASGKMHYVGGSKTSWGPSNVNLTEWSCHETFYVGDWLCKLIFFSLSLLHHHHHHLSFFFDYCLLICLFVS